MTAPGQINLISELETLTSINGDAANSTTVKKIRRFERHARDFIARSPFLILATSSAGGCDASPRGDGPGFAKCLDDTSLLLPERPGNRLADSMRNIVQNPEVGLLFMIPGFNDTLRVNGRAYITDHDNYLTMLSAKGKTPKLAIFVDVTEIYFHCPKAYIRSSLWDPSSYLDRNEMPTLGRMILEQINGEPPSEDVAASVDQMLVRDSTENLY